MARKKKKKIEEPKKTRLRRKGLSIRTRNYKRY